MKELFLFLSENIIFAWVILVLIILIIVFILLLFYAAFKENRSIRLGKLEISRRSEKVDGQTDGRGHDLLDPVDIQLNDSEWEPNYQESVARCPELKRTLANNLAVRLENQYNPEILLAVQDSGLWLAKYLVNWFDGKPQIIIVKKGLSPQDRAKDFLKIPMKSRKNRPDLFIAYEELVQNSGNMVIVDDTISSGDTVRSIVDGLKEKGKNVKAVFTITVDKAYLDYDQDYLKKNNVALAYLLTYPRSSNRVDS